MQKALDVWFKKEILVHEERLMRFLARVWPVRDERDDIRYEAYARVYEGAMKIRPRSPKAFLFITAKNLMIDRIRRSRIVSIQAMEEKYYLDVLVDEITPEQRVSASEELIRLARAFDRLPPKCREVVWLRRVKELDYNEIAIKLGISQKTIEKHLSQGARLLLQYMSAQPLIRSHLVDSIEKMPSDAAEFCEPRPQ